MNFLILTFMLVSSALFAQSDYDECRNAAYDAEGWSETIKERKKKHLVDEEIEMIQYLVDNCNYKGINAKTLKAWQEEGVKNKIKSLRYEAQFKDITSSVPESLKNHPDVKKIIPKGIKVATDNKKSCSPVDLRSGLPPVRNQDGVGWCYAFAAADLVSYKLKQNVSAVELAFSYNNSWYDKFQKTIGKREAEFYGGDMDVAIESLKRSGGACLEKDVRSDDNSVNRLINNLTNMSAYINGYADRCEKEVKAIFPNEKYSDFVKIVKETNRAHVLEVLRNRSCKQRIDTSHIKVKNDMTFYIGTGIKKHMQTIDEQLSKNNVIAMNYFSSILKGPDFEDLEGRHTSLIVGRRLNPENGECEYLVRNSWGRACDYYPDECDGGNIWIPKSRVNMGMKGVTYLE